jgi:sirohydrochlorin cobaltochelatase
MNKKAIITAEFGSSHTTAWEKAILPIENKIMQAFPKYDFERAFLSRKIIKILQSRNGMQVENSVQVLDRLYQSGYEEVFIQPLLVINGIEYEKLLTDVNLYKEKFSSIQVGSPLLTSKDDFNEMTDAMQTVANNMQTDAVIFMGHGSEHPANEAYSRIRSMLIEKQQEQLFIATVEGTPSLEEILPELKTREIKNITLIPFLLVAGDHAQNDMAGEDEDSWKSILTREGFQVESNLTGMGEWEAVQNLFTAHALACKEKNNE